MNKRFSTLVMLLALCIMTVVAQKQEPTTANYVKACEALDSAEYETAKELFLQELKLRPKDGFVWEKLGDVYLYQYDQDSAIICADKAIKLLPKNEKDFRCEAYKTRILIHGLQNEWDAVDKDIDIYRTIKPDDEYSYYMKSAALAHQEKYAESDAELMKLLNIYGVDKSEVYLTLARNMLEREDFAQALNYSNKAYELNRTSTNILTARSDAYIGLGNIQAALDDAVEVFKLDNDNGYHQLVYMGGEDAYRSAVVARLNKEAKQAENPMYWNALLYTIYDNTSNDIEAMRYLARLYQGDETGAMALPLAQTLSKYEINDKAYDFLNEHIQKAELTGDDLIQARYFSANLLASQGKSDEAIKILNQLKDESDYDDALSRRISDIYFYDKNPKEALKAINLVEDEDVKDASYWNQLARIYLMDGNKTQAREATQKAIESGDGFEVVMAHALNGDRSSAMKALRDYAVFLNTDSDMTEEVMTDEDAEKIVEESDYNYACLYSLIGEKGKAINFLKEALQNGWKDFRHIELDTDLDNIRQDSEFQSLVKMHRTLADKEKEELLQVLKEEGAIK